MGGRGGTGVTQWLSRPLALPRESASAACARTSPCAQVLCVLCAHVCALHVLCVRVHHDPRTDHRGMRSPPRRFSHLRGGAWPGPDRVGSW